MARAIFSHELGDPDFQWLLTSYNEQSQSTALVDAPCLPVVLVVLTEGERSSMRAATPMPVIPPAEPPATEGVKEPSVE
jgi:hypothetical protein